jgi:hypothetical protein
LPGCEEYSFKTISALEAKEFYGWFLDKGLKAGMSSFELDFVNQNFNCVSDFIESASTADTWMHGLADAALGRNVSLQWCYATPSDVLASIDLPSVTNFRVSFDFCYGRSWDIGESSLLVWALGAAPSKDTLWTTDNGRTATPGCSWTLDHEVPAAELHVVLSLMSTGPMGISDAIGMTNATLLKRAIANDGTLLQPTKAVTAVDSSFVLPSAGGRLGKDGYVYGTSGEGPSWIFVSFKMKENYPVRQNDFWPPLKTTFSKRLAYRQFDDGVGCINGTDAVLSGCVRVVPYDVLNPLQEIFIAPESLDASPGSDFAPIVTSVWQSCSKNGWFFLGELDKYVPLSPSRFQPLSCMPSGVSTTMKGTAGEIVKLTALRPLHSSNENERYQVLQKEFDIPRSRITSVLFGEPDPKSSAS